MMRAVVLDRHGGISVEEQPVPQPAPTEALVRVLVAGICDTDLQLQSGYMGFSGTPGHEFVGRVEFAPGARHLEGETVVGEINAACGTCSTCASGLGRHCPKRTVLGIAGRPGAFAELLTLPVTNLHIVGEVPLERAVFTEPLAAAFEIVEQVDVAGQRCLVLGAGKLGKLCAQVLRRSGAHVLATARRRESLELLSREGIETRLVDECPESDKFDVVVEATGSSAGLPLALARVRPRGTLVLKSTVAVPASLDLAPLVIDEITMIGSRCGPFAVALEALADGSIRPEVGIGARFSLSEAPAAFAAARSPRSRSRPKVIFDVDR